MITDIFDFWSESNIPRDSRLHPADTEFLAKTKPDFDFSGFPGCFMGPLRTAKVVLLYSAPGRWDPKDSVGQRAVAMSEWCARTRTGTEPLPDRFFWPDCYQWWSSRAKRFGQPDSLRTKIAFLNLIPYHMSGDFREKEVVDRLPSSKVALKWARECLFPEARAKKRVVVCLRAHSYWGVTPSVCEGFLYAPKWNRRGYLPRDKEGAEIVNAATDLLR